MNGHIIPNSNIAVDFWRIKGRQDNLTHFLTHLHGDHVVGLTSSWIKPIYCSNITANLLKSKYGISKQLLHILPLNESVVIDISSSESFTVTAFDANHCPGAVMFYFQGKFGNIFYTGDFRASESVTEAYHSLKEKVDVLYLDNTFCSPKCVFPTQEECFDKIVEIIRQHPEHNVVIGVRNLGKESMLARLGEVLNETIAVSPKMYNICQFLFETNVFTTIQCHDESRLRTIPLLHINSNSMQTLNRIKPCIAIMPTAIYTGLGFEPFINCPDIFLVPYSDHSSYTELLHFVSVLKPFKVVPIVTSKKGPFDVDISDRNDMSCFDSFLSTGSTSFENSTFKSHLLINNPSDSESGCQTTAQRHLQVTEDVKIYYNKKEYSNYNTETSFDIIRKRKRKQPPCRFKKKASGVLFEELSSDEPADQKSPSPEPKNYSNFKNCADTGETVQGSCDTTEKPDFNTKSARPTIGERSLESFQQCSGRNSTENQIGISFPKHMEEALKEEQEAPSCDEKKHDFSNNDNNSFVDKSMHNTDFENNFSTLDVEKEKKSSLESLYYPTSEQPTSCDDGRKFTLKEIAVVDSQSHIPTENTSSPNWTSSAYKSVSDIPKDISENNMSRTPALKTSHQEMKAQMVLSKQSEIDTILVPALDVQKVSLKRNQRQNAFVESRPLNENFKKRPNTSRRFCFNADKTWNLGDEVSSCSTFPVGIIVKGSRTKTSRVNSQSPAHVPVSDVQNTLGDGRPKTRITQDLFKPSVQQNLQFYSGPLKQNNKIFKVAPITLVKVDENHTEANQVDVRESTKIKSEDMGNSETSYITQGALPESYLLFTDRETLDRRSEQDKKSGGRDRSFVNAIKAFLTKK